ncbi:DUF3566 domain-containing protein [Mycobacterium sp. ITM-2016-00317]|uniref:DUF3566 domain-containing protein n=1 Tax=Mycobacterium sp. ITM-2016-00317 TaxID=2099694 RepID=UPI000D409502|nr:DUF3566 domain-containing protein [Mycobacterium sp. ITM-2016-00317]WNG87729.1 DUF3566 domain-containing protein [Mycobacterium sp. ITM-2016-00317]
MSSPKEPGHPRQGDTANGPAAGPENGARAPHLADSGDVPPWQRGPAGRARQPQSHGPEGAPGNPGPGNQAGLDARLNRFMAGGGQETDAPPRNDRTDVVRAEPPRQEAGARPDTAGAAYASELPDLSGGRPRQQRKPMERPPVEPQQPTKSPTKATPPAGNRALQAGNRQHRGPVRASMQIRRVDPWSTLKVSLLLSVVLFFVWMIAVAFLYLVLGGMGVWTKLNSNVGDLLTSASGSSGGELVSSGTIFGGAALIGLVNIVLMTAAATVGAFIYNLTTDLVGGVEVTLADRD